MMFLSLSFQWYAMLMIMLEPLLQSVVAFPLQGSPPTLASKAGATVFVLISCGPAHFFVLLIKNA